MGQIISIPFEVNDLENNKNYRTYQIDFKNKKISGVIAGKEAVVQAIWKIISTCRSTYLIYDDRYGCDIFRKINDNDLTFEYLESDIPAMIEKSLLEDERIIGISELKYEILTYDSVHISFSVQTIYGDIEIEGVIKDGS